MTRDEAHEKFDDMWAVDAIPMDDAIDMIYDDLESRICKNCKHNYNGRCMLIDDWDGYNDEPCEWAPPTNFGCNKFERNKDD